MVSMSTITFNAALTITVSLALAAATIFPEDRWRSSHFAKRGIRSDCLRCARTYNYILCLRCWQSKYAVIPFHSKRSSQDVDDKTGRDLLSDDFRYAGCDCCSSSRYTDVHCCDVCMSATMRGGKSSEDEPEAEREKRMAPACLCCRRSGSPDCCSVCYKGFQYY